MDRRRSSRRNARPKKSWFQKCKDCLRQFIAFLFSNVGIICLVVGYTMAGAVMFQEIEGKGKVAEEEFKAKLDHIYTKSLNRLWSIVESWNSDKGYNFGDHIEEELRTFQNLIVGIVHDDDYDGTNTNSTRWTLSTAFLYCLTVITTIGYGNVFPLTIPGKVATIVYAIFGMPLFLLYLSNIGDLLAKSFKWLYAKFCLCKICRLRKRRALGNSMPRRSMSTSSWRNATNDKAWPRSSRDRRSNTAIDSEESDDENTETETSSSSVSTKDPQDVVVPISLCLAIMIGFISLGALLFGREEKSKEGLSFLDGSYFCFISLSTIGFGDIVPPMDPSEYLELNFILCSIYLMLGMALIAMCFNLMQQDVVQKIRTCTDIVRRIARCRR